MGEVVSLKRAKEERSPHAEGQANCVDCRHVWRAVAPLGTTVLECPSCHAMKGLWTYIFESEPGKTQVYTCLTCDSTHLSAYRRVGEPDTRFMCVGCGSAQTMDSLFG